MGAASPSNSPADATYADKVRYVSYSRTRWALQVTSLLSKDRGLNRSQSALITVAVMPATSDAGGTSSDVQAVVSVERRDQRESVARLLTDQLLEGAPN